MKRTALAFALIMGLLVVTVISCKKTDNGSTSTRPPSTPENEATLQSTLSQNASDQTEIQSDEDLIEGDIQKAVKIASNFNGTLPDQSYPFNDTALVGAKIDMSAITPAQKKIIIYYQNINDNGVTKRGHVTIQLINGSSWIAQGAQIMETFDSVKVTKSGVTRIYQVNRYITNVLGGYSYWCNVSNPFIYKIRSYGTVLFPDNTTATYWIARKNSLSTTSAIKTIPTTFSSNGDTTVNGDTCTMGGTSRYKTTFRVKDSQTYAAKLLCGYSRPYLGVRSLIAGDTVKITFGVDVNGIQSGSDTTACGSIYGYKIEWTKLNGQAGSKVFSY